MDGLWQPQHGSPRLHVYNKNHKQSVLDSDKDTEVLV